MSQKKVIVNQFVKDYLFVQRGKYTFSFFTRYLYAIFKT